MDFFTIYGVGFGLENVTNFLTHLTVYLTRSPLAIFAEKRVLKRVKRFSGFCHAIKS